jgi:hypothetical protein
LHGAPSGLQLGPLGTHAPVGSHACEQHSVESEQLDPIGLQTGGDESGLAESTPESTPESVPSSIFPPQAPRTTPNKTKASARMAPIMY